MRFDLVRKYLIGGGVAIGILVAIIIEGMGVSLQGDELCPLYFSLC